VKRLTETASDLRGLLLIVLAGGWLTGILLSSWFALPQFGTLAVAACGLVITGIFWRQPVPRIIGLLLLCLGLGAWRYAAVSPRNDPQTINAFIGAGKLKLQAEIVAEPTLESNSTLLTVAVQSVSMNQRTPGEMLMAKSRCRRSARPSTIPTRPVTAILFNWQVA